MTARLAGLLRNTLMPTVLSHPAVVVAMRVPRRLAVAAVVLTILPDIDVLGFRFGIPYGSTFGHRGFTHSLAFAAVASAVATLVLRGHRRAFAILFTCAASHGLLDAMTDGGRGVAFFSPFSNRRYFLPWRPIRVSPIGAIDVSVLTSEVKWVWAPAIALTILQRLLRAKSGAPEKADS
jgi:inner membrane protein